jgi:hypothetical protein
VGFVQKRPVIEPVIALHAVIDQTLASKELLGGGAV